MEKLKRWLHQKWGWFQCVENRWMKVVEIESINTEQLEKTGRIFLGLKTRCFVCKKEKVHNITACSHTYFDIGETYYYAYMTRRCCCKVESITNGFREFIKKVRFEYPFI